MLALIIARPVSVFMLSFLINRCKKKPIPVSHQCALIYSGIRGAVAFYLVLNMTLIFPDWESRFVGAAHKSVNISTVVVLITFTVFFIGGTTK